MQLKTYEGDMIDGITLVAKIWFESNQPCSKRYRTLIVDGAEAANLDPKYLHYLRNLPYVDREDMKKNHFFMWLFTMFFMYGVLPILAILVVLPGFGFRMYALKSIL